MRRRRGARSPQDYSPEEFAAVVELIRRDPKVKADIEAITGASDLGALTARQVFDLYRTLDRATEVHRTIADFARSKADIGEARLELDTGRKTVGELETLVEQNRQLREQLAATQRQLEKERRNREAITAGPAMVVHGED